MSVNYVVELVVGDKNLFVYCSPLFCKKVFEVYFPLKPFFYSPS